MMKIQNLFLKDIARPINGVIKAQQLDPASVWQELDEYVITKELDQHIRKFFDVYGSSLNKGANEDRVGVWVSGFFGSGKSHFIKILSYLLRNEPVSKEGVTRKPIEFFAEKIKDPMLFADIKKAVSASADVILFNVDSKANPGDGDGRILNVFLRVFNEMQGFSGDHPAIAHMERHLQTKGRLDAFHAAFKAASSGREWLDERDAFQFQQDELIAAFAKASWQSEESSRKWLDDAEKNLPLTPENLAKWVKAYLDSKGPDHRILFFVDEVGQFIGTDGKLMLSLQTIVENLGTICGGRAWVVVTSQENLDKVLGEVKSSQANDFSKIQGRFTTRLSLSSANTDEVIQARLLSKSDPAKAELNALYKAKGDILKSQVSFTNLGTTSFKSVDSEKTFTDYYPFVPYQFVLVQRIFEEIRKHGATGLHLSRGERSMLEAFQLAGQQLANHEVGALAPLYRFYPSIESFLDTSVKRTIDQSKDRALEPFDIEILKVLFLVRYVEEFKANLDNLVTLCIEEVDTDRLALKRRIEASLQSLERETLVGRNGEDYFFLTNEERDVSQEIKAVELGSTDEVKKLGELIFLSTNTAEGVLKGNNKHRFPDNKKDFGFNRYCDGHAVGQISPTNDLVISVLSPLGDEYELYNDSKCILESSTEGGKLLIKLPNESSLGREIRIWLQTEKYISRKSDPALPHTIKKVLSDRREENRQRGNRLVLELEKLLLTSVYYVNGQIRPVKATSALAAITEQLTYLIQNTFGKLGYLKVLKDSADACRQEAQAVLRANDIGQQALALQTADANQQAIDDLRQHIQTATLANQQIILADLITRYGKRPYGWPEYEVILLLARLVVIGEIQVVADGGIVALEKVYDQLVASGKWRATQIVKRKTVDSVRLSQARTLGKDVFGPMGPDTEEPLYGFLREKLQDYQRELQQFQPLASTGEYPGADTLTKSLGLIQRLLTIRDSFEFIERFLTSKNDLMDLSEDYHELSHFYKYQKSTWDKLRGALTTFAVNRSELEKDPTAAAALQELGTIRKMSTPYGRLKDVDGLIAQVESVHQELIADRRTRALEKIDALLASTEQECARLEADDVLSNRCLYPLRQLRVRAEAEQGIGNLRLLVDDAIDAADQAITLLERPKPVPVAPSSSPLIKEPPAPPPAVRPSRTVTPQALMKKSYLESEADVQEFIDALTSELLAALADNTRIRIR